MPGPCSTSHSSTAPEKKGRLKSTTATAPRSASLRECTAMATEPVLYCKSSPQTKYIERNYKFKPRHTPKLDFTFLSSVLKNCMLNVLLGIQMCKNTHRKSKSCIFAQSQVYFQHTELYKGFSLCCTTLHHQLLKYFRKYSI